MALVTDNKQYGDMTRLAQLESGLKQGNADSVPTPRTPAGRPSGSGGTIAPTGDVGAPVSAIPAEHTSIMENAARALRVSNMARAAASDPLAGPWLRSYAQYAEGDAADKLRQVKDLTPDYHV